MTEQVVDLGRFREPQRQRAEALILVKYLFPRTVTGGSVAQLARWVETGEWNS